MEPLPGFFRVVVLTLIAGLLIVGTGSVILFLAFRSVDDGRKGERHSIVLSIALLAFIFICCAVIFAWSRQGN